MYQITRENVMFKSGLYIIFSTIFIFASVLIIIWIVQQESKEDKRKQAAHVILNEKAHDKKNISNQTNIVNYDKKDIDNTLLDIDSLVNLVEKTELPE